MKNLNLLIFFASACMSTLVVQVQRSNQIPNYEKSILTLGDFITLPKRVTMCIRFKFEDYLEPTYIFQRLGVRPRVCVHSPVWVWKFGKLGCEISSVVDRGEQLRNLEIQNI